MPARLIPWLAACALVAVSGAGRAECLAVTDNSVQEQATRYGITTADWTGTVHNACAEPYDATLTVRFRDTDGRILYKAVQITRVRGGVRREVSRRVNIPDDKYRVIDSIDVAVEERQRPR
jgi:hypothetical protein